MSHSVEFQVVIPGEKSFDDFLSFWDKYYEPSFPELSEREDFKDITNRIRGLAEPETYGVLEYDGGRAVASMILDWYPECHSLEIIYIATATELRWDKNAKDHKHYGKGLLTKGLDLMKSKLKNEVKWVFFECENPLKGDDFSQETLNTAYGRLSFFNNACCARRVMIDYYQPPLSADRSWCDALSLCIIPNDPENAPKGIPGKELLDFLQAFYDGLKKKYKDSTICEQLDVKLGIMARYISSVSDDNDLVPLDQIMDDPQLCISDYKLVTHFNIGDTLDVSSLSDKDTTYNSYECDLFKYVYQQPEHRPFHTSHYALIESVDLYLPFIYHYSSEGKSFYRISKRRETIPVDISLSISYRERPVNASLPASMKNQRCLTMVNVCFAPSQGSYFSEMDIIRLISALRIGSLQENVSCCPGIRIGEKDKAPVALPDFISQKINIPAGSIVAVNSGASELNLGSLTCPKDPEFKRPESVQHFVKGCSLYNASKSFWNKAFCGILLGIFDFDRMADHEIKETVVPFYKWANASLFMSRGHLMNIHTPETSGELRRENTLISPYLLIPSVALALNENLITINEERLALTEQRLSEQFSKSRMWMNFYHLYLQHTTELAEVKTMLDNEYIQEVFQYESESTILSKGTEHRGYGTRYNRLLASIRRGESRREEFRDKYTGGIDTLQNILLFALTGLQVTMAIAAIQTEKGLKLITFLPSIILVIVVLIIGSVFYIYKRRM